MVKIEFGKKFLQNSILINQNKIFEFLSILRKNAKLG